MIGLRALIFVHAITNLTPTEQTFWVASGWVNRPLARAVEREVSKVDPVFENDVAGVKIIALLTALGKFESNLFSSAVGDHGRSLGPFQKLDGNITLLTDEGEAVRTAIADVRYSLRRCHALPLEERLAFYARGRCDSERGRELSRHRFKLAKELAE